MSTECAKVLVVDDDATVRELLKALLKQNGYEVQVAPDGEAALAQLEESSFDIVLLDILMPRKEGLETIIDMKQRFPKTFIYAMSASGARKGHDFLSIAAKFGADGVLQKPFAPQDLLALLAGRNAPKTTVGTAASGH